MVSDKLKDQVWDKGKHIPKKNPDTWRRDDEGKIIRNGSHGTEGKYGWEIDHKYPTSKGGSDKLSNLRPLNTAANRKKADKVSFKKR